MAKRVQRAATPWPPPLIVRQVARFLDLPEDVAAFLQAVPSSARDAPLNALLTLLAARPTLWPFASAYALREMQRATVVEALPALCNIYAHQGDAADFRLCTPLPPTADVHVYATDVYNLGAAYGQWVRNIVSLYTLLGSNTSPVDVPRLQPVLAACPKLQTLKINFAKAVEQAQMDCLLTAVVASCPLLSKVRFRAAPCVLESCESLLKWVTQPRARTLCLTDVDFSAPAARTLAHVLISSPTLCTLVLEKTRNLSRALLDPSTCCLPYGNLRHLVITTDDHFMDATFPHWLKTLDVRCTTADHMGISFKLERLRLYRVAMSDAAFPSFCAVIAASSCLVRLDVAQAGLPAHQRARLIKTLPHWHWLKHQRHACAVRLDVGSASDLRLIAAAMTRLRNRHKVEIELLGNEELNVSACQYLITVLGTKSSMALRFELELDYPDEELDLQQYAMQRNVRHANGWYLSPQ